MFCPASWTYSSILSRHDQASLLSQTERYIKQAIVHKNPIVASSALLCGLYLLSVSPDAIRRWSSEIGQSLNYDDEMVQYHGFLLLYALKRNDRLALAKVGSTFPRFWIARRAGAAETPVFAAGGLRAASCRAFSASRRSRPGTSFRHF